MTATAEEPAEPRVHTLASKRGCWARVAHPCLPGRRLYLSGPTPQAVKEQAARVLRLRTDVKYGLRTAAEVAALLRRPRAPIPIEALMGAFVASLRHPPTRRAVHGVWEHQIAPFLGGLDADALTPETFAKWERWMRDEGYEQSTVRLAAGHLRSAWSLAVRDGKASGPRPWAAWKPKKAEGGRRYEKAASLAELEALIRAAALRDVATAEAGGFADLFVRVAVVALCGLRKGEACALAAGDVGLALDAPPLLTVEHTTIAGWRTAHPTWLRPLGPTKQRAHHIQRLHAIAARLIEWQIARVLRRFPPAFPDPDDLPVFPSADGTYRNNPEIIRHTTWKSIVRAARLPHAKDWVLHSLRHSMTALEDQAGLSLAEIAQRSGQSVATVERYVRGSGRRLVASGIGSGAPGQRPGNARAADDGAALLAAVEESIARVEAAELAGTWRPVRGPAGFTTLETRAPVRNLGVWVDGRRVDNVKPKPPPALARLSLGALARREGRAEAEREAQRRARQAYQAAWARARREALPGKTPAMHARRLVLSSWARAKRRASNPPKKA